MSAADFQQQLSGALNSFVLQRRIDTALVAVRGVRVQAVVARPAGPTCHTGAVSCFDAASRAGGEVSGTGDDAPASEVGPADAPASEIGHLARTIAERHRERPAGSYTTSLFEGGTRRIAQKVGEEGVETALAAVAQGDEELLGEILRETRALMVARTAQVPDLGILDRVLRTTWLPDDDGNNVSVLARGAYG